MIDPIAIAVFGWTEILLIAGVIVLLFGATRLPQIGKGLGEGIREFRKSIKGDGEDSEQGKIQGGGENGPKDNG